MGNFKGTKGKWVLEVKNQERTKVCGNKIDVWGFDGVKEMKANALLISKSPEMLEMLERIMKTYDKGTQTYLDCQQLIKAATEY